MIYEIREYYIAPGQAKNLDDKFKEVADLLFKKHGIRVIGYWNVIVGEAPKLVYILQFDDYTHRENAWRQFGEDPEWIEGNAKYGSNLLRYTVNIMEPTEYSPLQ